jgi:hypothetical protein
VTTDVGHVASSGQAGGPVRQVLVVPLRRVVAGPVRRMEGEPVRQLEAVMTRKGEFLRKTTCRCELYRLIDGHKCRQWSPVPSALACVATGSIQTLETNRYPSPIEQVRVVTKPYHLYCRWRHSVDVCPLQTDAETLF